MKCQEPHAQARSPSGETLNLSELFHCLLCEMGSFLGAVAGCRWADPTTLLETGAEVLLLFLLMTVEGWHKSSVQGFSKVRWSCGLRLWDSQAPPAQGILRRRGGSVDALCVHSQSASLGV